MVVAVEERDVAGVRVSIGEEGVGEEDAGDES
jgi:hypothetical protein